VKSDGAEVFYWKHAQASCNQLPPERAAGILLRVGEDVLTRPRHATGVVIELDICREVARVLLELIRWAAATERADHGGIRCRDRDEQRVEQVIGLGLCDRADA
jgi:hypothetical protein